MDVVASSVSLRDGNNCGPPSLIPEIMTSDTYNLTQRKKHLPTTS